MRMENTAPRRHPQRGGYARGEETRARIIAAAIRAFGEEGYDQASTRRIAASAGVNPPALQYYFDSKEGLHRACAQHIIDRVLESLSPALERAAAAARGRNADAAVDALCGILDALIDGLVATGSERWSRFIARGKADGAGPAMSMIRERIGLPLHRAVAQLIAVATRSTAETEATRLRASMVLGQVTSLYANRENTLAMMGWSQFDARGLALIKRVVGEHTRAAMAGRCEPMPELNSAHPRPSRRTRGIPARAGLGVGSRGRSDR